MKKTDSRQDEGRPRGRPRDPARMASVLEAAKRQFSEHGYEGASIDTIAANSGVSKVTIYSYFPTKAALFQAAITHRVESQFGPHGLARLDPHNPRAALTQIGRSFLALMRSPDVINQHRSLYGALGQETSAAESFFAAGPQKLVDTVEEYLRATRRTHRLRVTDTAMAANQYLSLFLGLGQVRSLLGLTPPTKREDDALLKANVELFLRAFEP